MKQIHSPIPENVQEPTKIVTKKQQQINQVVAEWMILANEFVAKRIYLEYPSAALLRHHPFPSPRYEKIMNKQT